MRMKPVAIAESPDLREMENGSADEQGFDFLRNTLNYSEPLARAATGWFPTVDEVAR